MITPIQRMSVSDVCRLCFSIGNDQKLNIFGDIGIELQMSQIIAEHFKCDINEEDSLPKCVCQMCWTTTEAFHELYQKSRLARERFLHPVIKIEFDATISCSENLEPSSYGEQPIDICEMKNESNTESQCLDDHDALEAEMEFEDNKNRNADESSRTNSLSPSDHKAPRFIEKKPRSRRAFNKRKAEFKKLFDEHKYRFIMTCDECSTVFESLEEARTHYAKMHNNSKGYIKCCNAKFSYRCEVERHIHQRHMEPKRFKCDECEKAYSSSYALKTHKTTHTTHTSERLICDVCNKTYSCKQSLKQHLKWHTQKQKKRVRLNDQYRKFMVENFDMSCDQCDSVFESFYDARSHYRNLHNNKKGYVKCCNTKLREHWIVADHVHSHLNPSKFKCDLCNKELSSRLSLRQHKVRHKRAIERPFACDICGKRFRNKESITRHIFTTHVNSDPKFECEICHKRFQLANLLKSHVYAVHRERKIIITCEICGKSFNVKANFDKHVLSHTDKSKRLGQAKQCEHCGEWLMTKSGIYYHAQIHTSGVQKCEQCLAELPNKMALSGHIRKHHRERTHKCSFCDQSFPVSSELKKHEEGHTRHNVYPCQFCTKVFTLRTSRLTHQRRTHREELKELRESRKLIKTIITP